MHDPQAQLTSIFTLRGEFECIMEEEIDTSSGHEAQTNRIQNVFIMPL